MDTPQTLPEARKRLYPTDFTVRYSASAISVLCPQCGFQPHKVGDRVFWCAECQITWEVQ